MVGTKETSVYLLSFFYIKNGIVGSRDIHCLSERTSKEYERLQKDY